MSDASKIIPLEPEVAEIVGEQLQEVARLQALAKAANTSAEKTINAVARTLKLRDWSFEALDSGQLVFKVPIEEVERAEEAIEAAEEKRDMRREKRLEEWQEATLEEVEAIVSA